MQRSLAQRSLSKPSVWLFIALAVALGGLVVVVAPAYVMLGAAGLATAYLAIRRPHWVIFGLLISKASLDNLSQTVTFFEGTPLTVNINGLLNVAVVLFAVVAVVGRYASVRGLPVSRAYGVLLALGALGFAVSQYRSDTVREWFRLASPFAVYILIAAVARRRRDVGWFVGLIAGATLVPLAVGLYQIIFAKGFDATEGFNRAYSTFWYPTSFGHYLLFALMVLIPLLSISRSTQQRLSVAALTGACGVALIFTYTRAAWIGLALAVAVFASVYVRRLLILGLVGLLLVVVFVPSVSRRFADLATSDTFSLEGTAVGETSGLGAANSVQWRLILWSDLVPFGVARPVLGNGLGSVANLAETTRVGLRMAAHNDYLRMLVEMGVLGLLVFLWLHVTVLKGAWRVYRKYRPDRPSRFALAFIGLYLAILAVSFVDNILSYHTIGWYVWAYAAVVHQL